MELTRFITILALLALGISTSSAQVDDGPISSGSPLEGLQEQLRQMQLKPRFEPALVPELAPLGVNASQVPAPQVRQGVWERVSTKRDEQIWQATEVRINPVTGRESRRTMEVIEVGSGLNYLDAQGRWQPTREMFEPTPDGGFIAQHGPHRVALENNINSVTAIDFISGDGVRLRNGPLAVGYYDPVSGHNEILAIVRDAAGKQTAPNEVVYFSAFDGLEASIRVTYRRGGMAADLVLHELPPTPAELGLSDQSRLEMYTEFAPETASPTVTERVLRVEGDPALRNRMVEADFKDQILDFGGYHMATGTAFALDGAPSSAKIAVGKRFTRLDGRPILIEAVEWQAAKKLMTALPPARGTNQLQASLAPRSRRGNETEAVANLARAGSRQFPSRSARQAGSQVREARLNLPTANRGFVLDYSLVAGATNFVFQSDKTYFVRSDTYLYGNTIFEGAVIKATNSAAGPALRIRGTVEFKTSDYNPLILTAQDDNTVGETLPWSTGNPWNGYYGNPALEIDSYTSGQTAKIQHVRVSHAQTAFSFFTGTGHELKHAQIVHSGVAFTPYYADVRLRNVLVHKADRVISGSGSGSATMRFEHLTASEANHLNYSSASTTLLTNSLLVAVTNNGTYSGANNATAATSAATFTTVGAGAHYLQGATYRAQGTITGVDPSLLKDIRSRTTQPPLVSTNTALLASITLNPRPELRYASGAAPDLGFHYPILDHVFGGINLTNVTLALNPGVALGVAIPDHLNYGLLLADGAKLLADGSPTNHAILVRSGLVQEQANMNWKKQGVSLVYPWWTPATGTETRLRFTKVFTRWNDEWLWAYGMAGTFVLRDSEFHGCATYNLSFTSVGMTNCLFSRTYLSGDMSPATGAAFRNNLFLGGTFEIYPAPDTTVRDNAFDRTAIPFQESITNSHNAYVTGSERLLPTNTTDKVLASLAYEKGALGAYYIPTGSLLINSGSQSAAASGLYHFTTTTNQEPEMSSTVDIGLHFPTATTNAQPNDADADGLADYTEDANGNGTKDTTETDLTKADTDNDGLSDYQEIVQIGIAVANPLNPDTNGNGINDGDDDADADLISNRGELDLGSKPLDAYSLNKSSNGNSVNKDAVFLVAASQGGQSGNGLARLSNPVVTANDVTLTVLDVTAPFTYDIYRSTDFFVTWQRFLRGTLNQTVFVGPNNAPGGAVFQAGSAGDWDGDGLTDGYEVIISKTSISAADTDGDGMADGWEVAAGLNPKSAADAAQDADGDGISNKQEYLADVNSILPSERIGPSSRRTPLVISEIMYDGASGQNEFVELYNSHYLPLDLSGYLIMIEGDQSNVPFISFAPGTTLAPNAYVIIVRNAAHYAGVLNRIVTSFNNNLPNSGGILRVYSSQSALLLKVEYSSQSPWPLAAAHAGHSLVLARPSFGEGDPRAWSASLLRGGSPGTAEISAVRPLDGILINEILAHATADFVELFNPLNQPVDVSGCYLGNGVNAALTAFQIAPNTVIPARGRLHFFQNQPGSFIFDLPSAGGSVYLSDPGAKVIDAIAYTGAEDGISLGRFPDGAPQFEALTTATPGSANSAPLARSIVISEIMFNPPGDSDTEEYIEIFNTAASGTPAVSLTGWSISGVGTINWPANAQLAPGQYAVIAKDSAAMNLRYPGRFNGNLFQFSGELANSGERIALINNPATANIVADEVSYGDGGKWTRWADGDGAALELKHILSDNRLPSNWSDSAVPSDAPWTTVEFTGQLLHAYNAGTATALEIILLGAGECLVDDVEVIPAGGANKISNGSFSANASGWSAQGNHELSIWSAVGVSGANDGSLHLKASGAGDYLDNRIVSPVWTPNLAAESVATIRAKVRWLRGDPNIVLRLRGNGLEAVGSLAVSSTVGTPGLANTGAANVGPAISEVTHAPVLPAASQPILVTARVHDPNGINSLSLRYRIDPSTTLTTVSMNDGGTGGDQRAGDGIYSAKIPGHAADSLVAFRIEAADSLGASSRFPVEEIVYPGDTERRECLVRIAEAGQPLPSDGFGDYRFWITQATINRWKLPSLHPNGRPPGHNGNLDATFVYDGTRAVYGIGARYSGSVWTMTQINGGYDSPVGKICGYRLRFPGDDCLLGSAVLNLDRHGTKISGVGNYEMTAREQLGNWTAARLGLPATHRRYLVLNVNGQRRGTVYEDAEKPNGDYLEKSFSGANLGELFKIERVWSGSEGLAIGDYDEATLSNFPRNGSKNLATYRWMFEKEQSQAGSHANNYQTLFDLVDAAAPNQTDSSVLNSPAALAAQVDVENWMRTIAMERACGNSDTYGYLASHNMYAYKPPSGLWRLVPYDFDYLAAGYINDLLNGPAGAPEVTRMMNHPAFKRAYLRGLRDAAAGPLQSLAYNDFIERTLRALKNNGVDDTNDGNPNADPYVDQVRNYFNNRRVEIEATLAPFGPQFAITTGNGSSVTINTTQTALTLAGTAPLEVATIQISGANATAGTLSWPSATTWNLPLTLTAGVSPITVTIRGYDRLNQLLQPSTTYTKTITITRQ